MWKVSLRFFHTPQKCLEIAKDFPLLYVLVWSVAGVDALAN